MEQAVIPQCKVCGGVVRADNGSRSRPASGTTGPMRPGIRARRAETLRDADFTGRAAAAFSYLAMRPGALGIAGAAVDAMPGMLTFGARLSGKTRESDRPDGVR